MNFLRTSAPAFALTALLTIATSACTDDDPGTTPGDEDMSAEADMGPVCVDNEVYNEVLGRCEPVFEPEDMGDEADDGTAEDMGEDMGEPSGDMPAEVDMGPCFDTTLYPDGDGDGVGVDDPELNRTVCLRPDEELENWARQAGDCDDNDRGRFPGGIEICDDVDNDCDMQLNQGIECSFYAHGPDNVYSIDPFNKTIEVVGLIDTESSMLDVDTHPDGRLFGITSRELWVYNKVFGQWTWESVGSLQQDLQGANGLAIDRQGNAYATARNELFQIDLMTGRATKLGTLSGEVNSSGDCVINKGGTLYMTSKDLEFGSSRPDDLVRIDRDTNNTTIIGRTSHARIFGLTAAWGRLFGLTADGELIEIDQGTGASELLHTFPDITFYGAASTPER